MPKKAKVVLFQDILKKLENNFIPTPLEIAESCKFRTRNQKQNEKSSEYIVALKHLTLYCNFVISKYRTTPHTTMGYTPAELLMKRTLRTHLYVGLVQPNLASRVEKQQLRWKQQFGSKKRERTFDPDEQVRLLSPPNRSLPNKWGVGKIVEVCGTKRYLVELGTKSEVFMLTKWFQPKIN